MKILDRYISKQFLNVLLFTLIAFIAIFLIVDLIENLDRFIDKRVPYLLVIEYYIYYLPNIFTLVLPVAMLLASLLSIGQFSRYNEITAMKSTGISLYRVALPLIVIGFLVSLGALIFNESIVPEANRAKFKIQRLYLDKIPPQIYYRRSNIAILEGQHQRVTIRLYDGEKKTAYNVSIQTFRSGTLISRIDAEKMVWKNNHWELQNGYFRIFSGDKETLSHFRVKDDLKFSFLPKDLDKTQKKPEEMNFFELRTFIEKMREAGVDPTKWLVDLQFKLAFPLTNLIIVLFGIPLAATSRRSGPALGFGLSLIIVFIFFGMIKITQSLGHDGTLSPFWAAWFSDLFFGTVGIFLLVKARK
ncbi:MAG: LPS export ABC transporter permease LptG [Calditrichaeota bacterium]|nr:LPS export ABC transporter permease LptG [Calditrichota bacterium]